MLKSTAIKGNIRNEMLESTTIKKNILNEMLRSTAIKGSIRNEMLTAIKENIGIGLFLIYFNQCSASPPSENIRKFEIFWCFQRV